MKKAICLLSFLIFCNLSSFSQTTPILISNKVVDDAETVTWRYKNYFFTSVTPMTARPTTTTTIYRNLNGRKVDLSNKSLFNTDISKMINEKMRQQYMVDKSESPSCFPGDYREINIDDLEINIDKNGMYFVYEWSYNYGDMLEGKTDCDMVFSVTMISIPIPDIDKFIQVN